VSEIILLGYRRVSTISQEEEGISLEAQEYLLLKAGVLPESLFGDTQTGMDDTRPGFESLLELALNLTRQGTRVRVVVTQADRLSRSLSTRIRIVEEFDHLGIELLALNRGLLSAKTASEWANSTLDAFFSEFTVRQIRENVKRAKNHAKEKGQVLGGRETFGYTVNLETKSYEPDLTLWLYSNITIWAVARDLFDYFLRERCSLRSLMGYSVRRHGRKWSHSGLYCWLISYVHVGHLQYNIKNPTVYAYNKHQALITNAEREQVLSILQENKTLWGRNAKRFGPSIKPLRGIVKCAGCGWKMTIVESRGHKYFYCNKIGCPNRKTVGVKTVESIVQGLLTDRAEELAGLATQPLDEIESTEVLTLKSQLNQLLELREKSGLMSLDASIQELQNRIAELQGAEQQTLHNQAQVEEIIAAIKHPLFWLGLTDEERRLTYLDLVESIVVLDGEIMEVRLRI
jgi:DNA invertase Pin-like site-specific DNA recombinase